jgi:hypothetical protein
MLPKEFIQDVLIDEIGQIHTQHPYISFSLMAIGIEFLGKCLNEHEDWNNWIPPKERQPNTIVDFDRAIRELTSFEVYRDYLSSHGLRNSLRNGFLHSFTPKANISVSSKDEMPHLVEHDGKINLRCEDFYNDFKNACLEIIAKDEFPTTKVKSPLLHTPGVCQSLTFSGTTSTVI